MEFMMTQFNLSDVAVVKVLVHHQHKHSSYNSIACTGSLSS